MDFFANILYNITHFDVWVIETFVGKNYFQVMGIIMFDLWLWVPFTYFIIKYIGLELWIDYIRTKWKKTHKYVLVAIDVPRKNEQSIAAMENVFTQILGLESDPNFGEYWWKGEYQLSMSCEIVSIEGYIQFLMRFPDNWRDVVEGAIYAQFPDAEITEVEDYVNTVPDYYPNNTHDMWGVEWSTDAKCPFYPIKMYSEFEDSFNDVFVDPLAGLLEAMSKIGKGEQIWVHINATPSVPHWSVDAQKEVDKQLGKEEEPEHKSGIAYTLVNGIGQLANDITENVLKVRPFGEGGESSESKKDDPFGKIWRMTAGQKDNLTALERKASKGGYGVKIRYGYFAEKGKMSKGRGVNAIIGAMKQFNVNGRNGLKPMLKKTGTKANYFAKKARVQYRQRRIVEYLKKRSAKAGMHKSPMCVEELATLFHFPSMFIRAPMLKRTEVVKSEAPTNLPFQEQVTLEEVENVDQVKEEAPLPGGIFQDLNLPEVEEKQFSFDYDSDVFEKRFARDKKAFEASRPDREKLLKKIAQEEEVKQEISEVGDSELENKVVPTVILSSVEGSPLDTSIENEVDQRSLPLEKLEEELKVDVVKDNIFKKVIEESKTSPAHEIQHKAKVDNLSELIKVKEETGLPLPAGVSSIIPDRVEYETEILGFFKGHLATEEKEEKKKIKRDDDAPPNLPFV